LVVVTDTLVEGVHFHETDGADDLGHKALAVNLSDLAAMGAVPVWALLNLTLPEANEHWLRQFSDGFFDLAMQHDVALVGGDTTRGPLCISVTAGGWVSVGQALTRSGAAVNDRVWITGTIGDAALALAEQPVANIDSETRWLLNRLHRPTPRVGIGLALYGLASAVIDISDGLLADLGHIVRASGQAGAVIETTSLPLSPAGKSYPLEDRLTAALTGGDDYELCLTVPQSESYRMHMLSREAGILLTDVGCITAHAGITLTQSGVPVAGPRRDGYEHVWSVARERDS
jgi:thiamine-monophosphate kinase